MCLGTRYILGVQTLIDVDRGINFVHDLACITFKVVTKQTFTLFLWGWLPSHGMQLYLATAKNAVHKSMSSGLGWRICAALGAGLFLVAIVAFWPTQSTPPDELGQGEETSGKHFSIQLHDVPRALPAFSFSDKEKNSVQLPNFIGKFVLLNLWATWCAPCIKELPALDQLEQILGGPDFVVVALNLDRGGLLEVNPFWTRTGLSNLDIYLDPTMSAGQTLSARGLPTTLLVNRNGFEIARLEGPAEWDSAEAISYFRTLISAQ